MRQISRTLLQYVSAALSLFYVALGENGLDTELLLQLNEQQCRQNCMSKFDADDLACLQKLDCSICDFPTYQFHRFHDAVNLMCWNSCASPSSSTSSSSSSAAAADMSLNPHGSNTNGKPSSDIIELKILSMVRDGVLTSVDIAWKSKGSPSQCLVTWEVFGGGIMGNLLTDTPEAQLSLWSDSKYHMQVTCKNKIDGKMSKSIPILIDTANAIIKQQSTTIPTENPFEKTTEMQPMQSSTETSVNDRASNINVNHRKTAIADKNVIKIQPHSSLIASDHSSTTNINNIRTKLAHHQIEPSRNHTWNIRNLQIESLFVVFCVFIIVLVLVICSIFSMRRRALNQECDKRQLIRNECEIDFSSSTTSIISPTAMHV